MNSTLKPSFSVNFATDPPQLKSQFLNAFIKSFKKLKTCKHRQFDLVIFFTALVTGINIS